MGAKMETDMRTEIFWTTIRNCLLAFLIIKGWTIDVKSNKRFV